MPAVTIRNLSAELHRALKLRAAEHGRSAEAEIREILRVVVLPEDRLKIGSALADFGRRHGGLDLKIERAQESAEPASFE